MAKILIKNGRVWDGENFYYADVLTYGEKIIKIEDNINESADFKYDAKNKIVSAGLVDVHTHLRGINKEFGIHAELSCIPFGVTSVADACAVYGDKALLESFLIKNVIFVPVEIRDNKAFFNSVESGLIKYGEKLVGIKVYFDTMVSDLKDETPLYDAVEYAQKHGLIVMVHSSNSPVGMAKLLSVLRKGDILTHAYHGGMNNASDDNYEGIKKAKDKGVIVDAGLAGHVHTDFNVLKYGIDCGAGPDIISTDITRFSAYKRGGRYGMTMCMNIAKKLGMTEYDIFRAVTSVPAKSLGKENIWGYLKVGRCADVAVFDYTNEGFDLTDNVGNRIVSDIGYRCVLTLSDGEVVYKD